MLSVFTKGTKFSFNMYLKHSEVSCGCKHPECKHTFIDDSVVDSFYKTRMDFGEYIVVTSGFRCQRHNKEVGGINGSFHSLGMAADLASPNLDRLESIARKYFDVVIRYDSFIHCHNDQITKKDNK